MNMWLIWLIWIEVSNDTEIKKKLIKISFQYILFLILNVLESKYGTHVKIKIS